MLDNDGLDTAGVDAQLNLIEEWRKLGPLGKLHNFIVYIQSSPQRMQKFLILSEYRRLARDNKTRWNSWERALRIATDSKMCDAINTYFDDYIEEECNLDRLTPED